MPSDSTPTPDEHDAFDPEIEPEVEPEIDAPQVMLVRVAETVLAIPVEGVREVLRGRPATRVPGTPAWVAGLVAVRGTPIPVADLQRRSGGPIDNDAPWLLVVEHDGRQAALGVTGVDGVHPVAETTARAPEERPSHRAMSRALPRSGAVRLLTQGSGGAGGAPDAADVLDVAALFGELFEGD